MCCWKLCSFGKPTFFGKHEKHHIRDGDLTRPHFLLSFLSLGILLIGEIRN